MIPMFLFSGAFFPISNLDPVLECARPADAAVARRRPDPDAHCSAPSTGRLAAIHVVYLVVLAVVGSVLAVRRLTQRLVD